MQIRKKLTSVLLAFCLILSVAAVGVVPAAAETETGQTREIIAQDTVQGSAILHCFCWSYDTIKENLPEIAAAGYTAVQTSPVQPPKDYSPSWTDTSGQWWKLYQPLDLAMTNGTEYSSWLGTKAQFTQMCSEADKYGIKVIVDIVSNHLANNGTTDGSYGSLHSDVNSDFKNQDLFYVKSDGSSYGSNSDSSRFQMTHGHLGMPELNTSKAYIQNKVLDLMKECVDCGADGFRFDTAKHIELPTDDDGTKSDFWPTVINGINNYQAQKGGEPLYIYGEILGDAYSKDINRQYVQYMDLTDDYTSYLVRNAVRNNDANALHSNYYQKEISADQAVLWAESHDTYMNDDGNSKNDSLDTIVKTWAMINSRADSTSLFFVRPGSMGTAGSDTTWKSTPVVESNKFKNIFEGQGEYLSYNSSYNAAYNERGTKGMVIVKTDGAGSVSIDLNENDVIKVKDADGNWYPKGGEDSNYTVTSFGSYKIYFRPNANGNNDWHKYTFYLANVTPCKITWVDGDGRTIATDTVIYGETPEYTGETPTKTADAQYSYTFAGWSPEIGAVTGDMTYTATFNSTVNSYTITFENEDGTVLQSTEEEYGTTPEYTGETPTKTADAQSHYNWSGIWTPIISEVTGDAVYTAEFTPAPHTWGENPEWSFSSDNKSATATFTCSECGFTDSVTTTDITLSYGKNCCIYTAKAEFNGTAFKGQKSVECDPFIGHNLFLNGDIGINYYLNISDEDVSAGKVKVVFTWFDKEKIITVSESQKADDNLYKLACNVAPAEMTYDITANYYVDDVLIDSEIYSVKDYANRILNDETVIAKYKADEEALGRNGGGRYNKLRTLVLSILDYGARAQERFGRNTDKLANGGTYTQTYAVSSSDIEAKASDMTLDLGKYGLEYKGSTVVYLSEITLRHYYKIIDADKFAQYSAGVTMNGKTVEYGSRDGMIYFDAAGIEAYNTGVLQKLKIGTTTYEYSVLDFLKKLFDTDNQSAVELGKANYRYYVAAQDYFNVN